MAKEILPRTNYCASCSVEEQDKGSVFCAWSGSSSSSSIMDSSCGPQIAFKNGKEVNVYDDSSVDFSAETNFSKLAKDFTEELGSNLEP